MQILAVKVFNQLQGQARVFGHRADHTRSRFQAETAARGQAPFAGQQPVTPAVHCLDDERLDDAVLADGQGQVSQLPKILARLLRIRVNKPQWQRGEPWLIAASWVEGQMSFAGRLEGEPLFQGDGHRVRISSVSCW